MSKKHVVKFFNTSEIESRPPEEVTHAQIMVCLEEHNH
jgi:hypothetical protein